MGSTITAETIIDGNNTTKIEYFYDSYGPYGFSIDGTFYYYVKNLQGDVTQIRDENNNLIASYVYDAWGKVLSLTENTTNNIGAKNAIRYRGYYYDTESNLYYLNARYYDPQIKRFISPDAMLGANSGINVYNLYAYCGNNPINYVDYTGEFPVFMFFVLAVVVCAALCGCDSIIPSEEYLKEEILSKIKSPAYDTLDEAVIAVMKIMMKKTQDDNVEYASNIFTYDGKYYYGDLREGDPYDPYYRRYTVAYDLSDGVPNYDVVEVVAHAHTHPLEGSFSPEDKRNAINNRKDEYVGYMSNGSLIIERYSFATDSVDRIYGQTNGLSRLNSTRMNVWKKYRTGYGYNSLYSITMQ